MWASHVTVVVKWLPCRGCREHRFSAWVRNAGDVGDTGSVPGSGRS